jgi:hypothetical protein
MLICEELGEKEISSVQRPNAGTNLPLYWLPYKRLRWRSRKRGH